MFKEINDIISRLEQIQNNLKKNPNRKFTTKYILRISVELKELKKKFNTNLQKLIKAGVNNSSIENCKEKFINLNKYIDENLTNKILAITEPGDITREEISEEDLEESSDEEKDNIMPDSNPDNIAANGLEMTTLTQILASMHRAEQERQATEQCRLEIEQARQETEFLNLINQLIPHKYDGSTKGRQDFLTNCRLLKDRATTPSLERIAFDVTKGKLKGAALTCLSPHNKTIDDIITDIESNLKVDDMPKIQQRLRLIKLRNMSRDKFKEELVNTLEELERSFVTLNADANLTKKLIMEETYNALTEQTNNMALHGLIKSEKATLHSPSQLVDYFFSQLDRDNSSQIMSFRTNENNPYNRNNDNRMGNNNNNNRGHANNNRRYNNNNREYNNRNNNNYNQNNYNNVGYNNREYNNTNRGGINNYNRSNNINNNNNNNRFYNRSQNNSSQNNQRSMNYNYNNQNSQSNTRNPNNTRNIHSIQSENFETHQSHGDMDGY